MASALDDLRSSQTVSEFIPVTAEDFESKNCFVSDVRSILKNGKDLNRPTKGIRACANRVVRALLGVYSKEQVAGILRDTTQDYCKGLATEIAAQPSTDTFIENTVSDAIAFIESSRKAAEEQEIADAAKLKGMPKFERSEKSGLPVWNEFNVRLALSALKITIRKNEFTHDLLLQGLGHGHDGPMTDNSSFFLRNEMSKNFGFGLGASKDLSLSLFGLVGHSNKFHPVKDYLNSLKWDGVARLDTWLIDHAGVEDSPYVRAASSLPLLAAVKRIYTPGAKFDELMVLISKQGWNKSSAVEALMPNEEWFLDDLDLGAEAKIVLEMTGGKWLIEAQELHKRTNSEHTKLKSFLARKKDKARLSYDRMTSEVGRQFVMIGTSNTDDILSDASGNRRYWPIVLGHAFDLEALRANRDQIWAECVVRINAGESTRMDSSLWDVAAEVQKNHTQSNPYVDILAPKLNDMEGRILYKDLYTLCGASSSTSPRLKQAMSSMGWGVKKTDKGASYATKGTTDTWLDIFFDKGKSEWVVNHPGFAEFPREDPTPAGKNGTFHGQRS